jgi:hypothetical protein
MLQQEELSPTQARHDEAQMIGEATTITGVSVAAFVGSGTITPGSGTITLSAIPEPGHTGLIRELHALVKVPAEDPVIRRTGLFLDFLLPPSRAGDALLNLEVVYYSQWLPKHGSRIAGLIFAVQGAGIICGFWGPRTAKWLGGALGLLKLFGWFSGLRGG